MANNAKSIYLKPEVKRLIELHPSQRDDHWLEKLAAAAFDLDDYRKVTPEQRRFTKTAFFIYIYGGSTGRMIDAFEQAALTAEQAAKAVAEFHRLYPNLTFKPSDYNKQ